ncbi:MAG: bifunctional 2-C-methyl-D-erythritol 4-phosphate cytidylyltransferase/2-C-methyl-D-erythritol 2,4-cyclodiphosphate synthase [Proteobacteria bacterium]|nr:bifunctional 2-C-methyl-D-erythritol 4-phosphate cytidylyltransferase/2-C-methyl-D-erythritol 2,4-cyclodiphosphate synthase [Pseudomonadota bacterium]MDA1355758.1 bifunctional 2-C-methyl-D-erythritol 4-phosphate cytidylyltransferase/2-C-methyl-D-erythritol 2,4-cyclodiphosphate synthase [Pseudomonadota bacterium]
MPRTVALIVAAGRGHRVGGPLPKQYRELAGHPVLFHTIRAFTNHAAIDAVCTVIHPDDEQLYRAAVSGLDSGYDGKLLTPVHGGETRQDSVRLGLESLAQDTPRAVLIHDGARPLIDGALITRTIGALEENIGAIAALPISDSIKRATADSNLIDQDVARAGLWRAQTPQSFRFEEILAAHRAAEGRNATDDAAVAEMYGLGIVLVEGREENIKITTESDMARAELILQNEPAADAQPKRVKVGIGYDVHRFAEDGDHLMLCGVPVPFERGVMSHSDGDVALHALVDAILGALGEGDIGVHFPPSEEKWRDAKSEVFVVHALDLLAARRGTLDHVDITLICERPKLKDHRAAMQAHLASLLSLPHSSVNLKATTTEKLGFTGREEGIAAQAVVTLRIPATGNLDDAN